MLLYCLREAFDTIGVDYVSMNYSLALITFFSQVSRLILSSHAIAFHTAYYAILCFRETLILHHLYRLCVEMNYLLLDIWPANILLAKLFLIEQ